MVIAPQNRVPGSRTARSGPRPIPPRPPDRRRRRVRNGAAAAQSREAEVYATALRLFRDKGYHATSIQDIAEALELQKSSLYTYIRTKEDLLIPAFERSMGALLGEMEQIAAATHLSPTERLRQAIHAHITAVTTDLDALTVYLSEWRELSGDALAGVRQKRERYSELLKDLIADGVHSGEFRPVDFRLITLAVIGMCNWLYRWYRPDGRLTPDQIADQYTDFVLHGLLP